MNVEGERNVGCVVHIAKKRLQIHHEEFDQSMEPGTVIGQFEGDAQPNVPF
ncbi:unnamed protein product [Ectocarpus sp. 6 AP-2014]